LGSLGALRHLSNAAQGASDATYLRHQYEEQGSAEGMVNAAISKFRGGQ
jgi:glutamate---cysteine ligase / carboxylate-amine ligase